MRKRNNIPIALFMLYCLSSCVDKECSRESSILDINATIHSTVIAKQTFIQDDSIGVYLVAYNDGIPGLLGDINLTRAANVEYIFDSSGYWFSKNGIDLFLDNEPSDLYTYYPYDEEMSREPAKANLTAYPFEIEVNQQTAGGETSDFLWAKIPALSASNYTAPIVFQHLMCRCEINIRLAEGIEITGIPPLEVHNTRRSCTINLRNGEVTPTGGTETITPSNNRNITPGYDFTYDAIIVPQTLGSGILFLTIVLGDESFAYQLPGDMTLDSQQFYIFNLVAGQPLLRSQEAFLIDEVTGKT